MVCSCLNKLERTRSSDFAQVNFFKTTIVLLPVSFTADMEWEISKSCHRMRYGRSLFKIEDYLTIGRCYLLKSGALHDTSINRG